MAVGVLRREYRQSFMMVGGSSFLMKAARASHTVEFDPFIKLQLASHNEL